MNFSSEGGKFLESCTVQSAEFDFVIAFPSTKFYINHVLCCIVNSFLTFTTVFLNALTVMAYRTSPQLQKKASYFLVMLLALNDIAVGLFCNSTYFLVLLREILGNGDCYWSLLSRILSFTLAGMSCMTLLILNIERYLSIIHPIFHRNKVTKRKLLKTAMLLWCFCVAESCVLFINGNVGILLMCLWLAFFLLTVAFIYTRIFCAVCRNSGLTSENSSTLNQKRLLRNIRQAKSCLIVVLCNFVCFLPTIFVMNLKKSPFNMMILLSWSSTLIFSASSLNSVIFFWRNRILKNEAKKILRLVF